jgi:uncharacterized protein (TIGR03435 family)
MRMLRIASGLLMSLALGIGAAQSQTSGFDAASVKRRTEPGGGSMGRQPGGRFTAQGVSLQDLIVFAYDIQPYQIVGGPRWLDTDRWDIVAAGAAGSPADGLIALQRLLADRFSLAVRREMREMPVYALVLARADGRLGPQLKRSAIDCAAARIEAQRTGIIPPAARICRVQGRIGSIEMGGSAIADVTPLLSTRLQRTVIDRTGLTGPWDLTLTYTPEPSQISPGVLAPGSQPAFDPNGPSLFTAVQEQLGLKLESMRTPVDVLVIDRAEFPREN